MRAVVFLPATGLVCLLAVQGIGVRTARAASAAEAPALQPSADESAQSLAGFEALVSLGYGASTSNVRNLELEPIALRLGLDVGYVWRFGFRLGLELGYGLGRSVSQRRTTLLGEEFDLTADASSMTGAIAFGYDVPLDFLVLRYSLGMGAISMKWDLGGIPASSFFNEEAWESPTWGFFLAPGASLFWRRGLFEVGLGFDYQVQTNGGIPTGLVGELLTGVKW
ncbi:MAG TPA: hypothetical protein VIW29_11270 [Polyangiaceae bacterium]